MPLWGVVARAGLFPYQLRRSEKRCTHGEVLSLGAWPLASHESKRPVIEVLARQLLGRNHFIRRNQRHRIDEIEPLCFKLASPLLLDPSGFLRASGPEQIENVAGWNLAPQSLLPILSRAELEDVEKDVRPFV